MVGLHDDKHVIKVGRDDARVERAVAVDKHHHDNVVADVSLAMQLLSIFDREWQHVTHVKHHFVVSKRRINTMFSSTISKNKN
jgi:hypothetical protein